MKEYHGEKRYKDYLLKRYSISREGHLMKNTHGRFTGLDQRKKGGVISFTMVWQI